MAKYILECSDSIAEAIDRLAEKEGKTPEQMALDGLSLHILKNRFARQAVETFPDPDSVRLNIIVTAVDDERFKQYYLVEDPENEHYWNLELFDDHPRIDI